MMVKVLVITFYCIFAAKIINTTEQLVKAARTVKPKVLFSYHYGQTDVSGVPSQLQGDGIDVRIRHYE